MKSKYLINLILIKCIESIFRESSKPETRRVIVLLFYSVYLPLLSLPSSFDLPLTISLLRLAFSLELTS
jgi:hypothetical protein